MKMTTMFVVMGLSLCSFGESVVKPILGATKFNSDLYTIQFTLAELSDDFEAPQPWLDTNSVISVTNYIAPAKRGEEIQSDNMIIDPALPKASYDISEQIRLSNPSYTNFATVYAAPDQKFSSANGGVKGTFDLKNKILKDLQIKFKEREINVDGIAISNEWHCIIIGGWFDNDGKMKNYAIMIKSYPPQK